MPRRREPLDPPRDYVTKGDWPNGVIRKGAPLAVHYMQAIAVRAREELERQDISLNQLTTMTNLDRSTLRLVLNGYKWPDIVTIVKMEQALGITLWPTHFYVSTSGGET